MGISAEKKADKYDRGNASDKRQMNKRDEKEKKTKLL